MSVAVARKNKIKMSKADRAFSIVNYLVFALITIICAYPFYYLIINSISANDLSNNGLINIIPQKYDQDTLIEEVLAVNPNTIIVMMEGNAVSMGRWKDKAKAILWQWYCGMEGGNVLADILFGNVNPSGKLPESMPYRMEDCGAVALGEYPGRPLTEEEHKCMDAHTTMTYKDSIYVGYRYYEKYHVPVQYCFGHGLSYTTFDYFGYAVEKVAEDFAQEQKTVALRTDEALDAVAAKVLLVVENTGERSGKEIVQAYVGKAASAVERPVKELRGFDKVELKPGEYQIYIGKSLEDIQGKLTVVL